MAGGLLVASHRFGGGGGLVVALLRVLLHGLSCLYGFYTALFRCGSLLFFAGLFCRLSLAA